LVIHYRQSGVCSPVSIFLSCTFTQNTNYKITHVAYPVNDASRVNVLQTSNTLWWIGHNNNHLFTIPQI